MLAALGTWLRLDGAPGLDLVSVTESRPEWVGFAAGSSFGLTHRSDTLAVAGLPATIADSGDQATSVTTALTKSATAIGAMTAMPAVGIAQSQSSIAEANTNGAETDSNSGSHAETTFRYIDFDPNTAETLFGAINLVGVGTGAVAGNSASWGHTATWDIEVWSGGFLFADVHVTADCDGDENGSSYSWIAEGVMRDEHDDLVPFFDSSTALNLYLTFTAAGPVLDLEEISITCSVGNGNGAQASAFWGPSEASTQFIESALVYFWAEGPNPREPQDINGDGEVDGQDFVLLRNNFNMTVFPNGNPIQGMATPSEGDLDLDGDVDEDDFEAWAAGAPPEFHVISTLADDNDTNYDFGDYSLREALAQAQDGDTILFPPWIDEIVLSGSSLTIADDVEIDGFGALTIDGNGGSRVFSVSSGVEATIRGLTITGGNVTGDGGGISNAGDLTLDQVIVKTNDASNAGGGVYVATTGYLTLNNSTIDDNDALYGGGIFGHFETGTRLTITGSTISNNRATSGSGGGINFFSVASTGSAVGTIDRSTFSNNSAAGSGGVRVRYSSANLTITNSTIAYNKGDFGGGLSLIDSPNVTLTNTIVSENRNAANTADNDIQGVGTPTGTYNLVGKGGSAGLSGTGNVVLTTGTALLAPLGDYGGKTRTHALLTSSPAINTGTGSSGVDQRGVARPQNGTTDKGAFESGVGTVLTVRENTDRNSTPNADDLSLREAIARATSLAGKETIIFDESLYSAGPWTLTMTLGEMFVGGGTTIAGPGADKVIIDGDDNSRVFTTYGDVEISGVTVTGGNSTGQGGGIYNDNGNLILRAARITGNYSSYPGGGISSYASSSATGAGLHIFDSEISDNYGADDGGGINVWDFSASAEFEVINSTISCNTSSGSGAGIFLDQQNSSTGFARIINSTITNNHANNSSAIWFNTYDNVTVVNSIIAANTADNDIGEMGGTSIYGWNNFVGYDPFNQFGGMSTTVDLEDIGLAEIAFNGGPTRTHRLLSGSAAIDAGDDSIATTYDLAFDQRGRDRIDDGDNDTDFDIDIGAFELAFGEIGA
jgi:hypothetical protein